MPCYAAWIFLDDAGHAWALGVNPAGQLTLSQVIPVPPQAMQQVPLKDTVDSHVYGIRVAYTPSGPKIQTTGALTIPAVGPYIPISAAGRPFWLQTASGRLIGSWQGPGGPADPVVGQLYNYDMVSPALIPPNLANAGLPSGEPGGWLPNYTQSAIGAPSFPAQQTGVPYSNEPSSAGLTSQETGIPFEQGMGMNTAGCGHWFGVYEQTWTTVGCQTECLVRCPLCGYVQQMFPLAVAYDQYHEHIST